MAQIHKFNSPVDLSKESIGNYYVNLYDSETGEFFEGRHYEMFSGNMILDEVKHLKNLGFKVEW